jgi:O-antigen ligase
MNKLNVWAGLIVITFVLAFFNTQIEPTTSLIVIVGIAIFTISFFSIESALFILIFSMLLGPEIMVGELTKGGGLGRGITLRLDDFLMMIIGFSWLARAAVFKELGLLIKTPLNLPILFYALSCFFASGWGMAAGRVQFLGGILFVLKYMEYFIIYFMVANYLQTEKQAKRLVFCALLTCFLVSLYGLAQIPTGQRVTAPFEGERGEPNTFGGYLVLMMSLASGLLLQLGKERGYHKIILGIIVLTAFSAFIFTLSRASYVSFIVMYISLLIFNKNRKILAIGLVFGVVLGPSLFPGAMKKRIEYTFSQPVMRGQVEVGGVKLDTSTSLRVMAWRDAFRDFIKSPLLGYGVTGYGFMDAQIPRTLLETGVMGLLAFFYLWYSIFRVAYQRLNESTDPYHKGLALGFLCGFIALVCHSMGTNTFIIVRIMEPFWLFTGIVVVSPHLKKDDTAYSKH